MNEAKENIIDVYEHKHIFLLISLKIAQTDAFAQNTRTNRKSDYVSI